MSAGQLHASTYPILSSAPTASFDMARSRVTLSSAGPAAASARPNSLRVLPLRRAVDAEQTWHSHSHHAHSSVPASDSADLLPVASSFRTKQRRQPVACEPCRASKRKCSGGVPCDSCSRRSSKNIVCRYDFGAKMRNADRERVKQLNMKSNRAPAVGPLRSARRTKRASEKEGEMDWSARITPFPAVMTDVVNTETGKRPLADDDTMDLSRSQSGGHRYTTRSSVRASMTGTAAADSGVTELQFCGEDGSEMLAEGDQAVYDKAESTSDTTSCSESSSTDESDSTGESGLDILWAAMQHESQSTSPEMPQKTTLPSIGSLGLPQPMRLGHKQGPVAPSSPAHYHLISSPTQALSSSQSGSDHSRVFSMPGPHEQRCHASPPRLSLSVAINRATSARRSDLPRVATIGSRPELFNFSPHRSRPLRRHPTFFPSPSTTLSGSGISFSS